MQLPLLAAHVQERQIQGRLLAAGLSSGTVLVLAGHFVKAEQSVLARATGHSSASMTA
jgi:hypothetical protein